MVTQEVYGDTRGLPYGYKANGKVQLRNTDAKS